MYEIQRNVLTQSRNDSKLDDHHWATMESAIQIPSGVIISTILSILTS
jgi:hypothetical protein